MTSYLASDWYWSVGGQIYSSKAVGYVPTSDTNYKSWLARGNAPTKVSSEQELADVLAASNISLPAGWTESDAGKDQRIKGINSAVLKALYRHENLARQLIRALRASSTAANNAANTAGLPSAAASGDLTPAQFLIALRSII